MNGLCGWNSRSNRSVIPSPTSPSTRLRVKNLQAACLELVERRPQNDKILTFFFDDPADDAPQLFLGIEIYRDPASARRRIALHRDRDRSAKLGGKALLVHFRFRGRGALSARFV